MRFALLAASLLVAAGVATVASCSSDEIAPASTDASTADGGAVDAVAAGDAAPDAATAFAFTTPMRPLRIVEMTKQANFIHDSAHTREQDVADFLRARGHEVTVTDDSAVFTAALATADVALFFVTSGVILDDAQLATFTAFIHSGHGFAGVHTADETENNSPFVNELLGGVFYGHDVGPNQVSDASMIVEDPTDRVVSFLPRPFVNRDEWHYFITDPAKNPALHPLLSIDESTLPTDYPEAGLYAPGKHFNTWKQTYQGARSFFTALGHEAASYTPSVLELIARGIEWAGAPVTQDVARAGNCAVPSGSDGGLGSTTIASDTLCVRYPWPLAGARDVTQGKNGAIYVTELKAKRVSRLTASGFVPVATGLKNPIGVREAPDGTLLVAEEVGQSIASVDVATGTVTPFATALDNVTHLAFGADGALYASTFPNFAGPPAGQVRRIDLASPTTPTTFATGLFVPEGLAFDTTTHELFVAAAGPAAGAPTLLRFGTTGGDAAGATTLATGMGAVFGVAPRPGGGVFYVLGDRVVERLPDGTQHDVVSGLVAPAGLSVADDGDLLVVESVVTNSADGYLLRIRRH